MKKIKEVVESINETTKMYHGAAVSGWTRRHFTDEFTLYLA